MQAKAWNVLVKRALGPVILLLPREKYAPGILLVPEEWDHMSQTWNKYMSYTFSLDFQLSQMCEQEIIACCCFEYWGQLLCSNIWPIQVLIVFECLLAVLALGSFHCSFYALAQSHAVSTDWSLFPLLLTNLSFRYPQTPINFGCSIDYFTLFMPYLLPTHFWEWYFHFKLL